MRSSAEFQNDSIQYPYVNLSQLSTSSIHDDLIGITPNFASDESLASFPLTVDNAVDAEAQEDLLCLNQDATSNPAQSPVSYAVCDSSDTRIDNFGLELLQSNQHLSVSRSNLTNLPKLHTQTPYQHDKLSIIQDYVDVQYNPAYDPPSAAPSIVYSFPPTAEPSVVDDHINLPSSIPTDDITGQSNGYTYLHFEGEVSRYAAEQLRNDVDRSAYRVQNSETTGMDSLAEALQRSMSFEIKFKYGSSFAPPTREQLSVMLRSQLPRGITQSIELQQILQIIDMNGQKIKFGLGIIMPSALRNCFKVTACRVGPSYPSTLWLFHKPTSGQIPGFWRATIPHVLQNYPSYASVVQAKTSPIVNRIPSALPASIPSNQSNSDYLNVVSQRLNQSNIRTGGEASHASSSRGHTSPSSQRSSRGIERHSLQASRAHSRATEQRGADGSHEPEKPHKCHECGKSFTYRKDVIRHSSVHTRVKGHRCPHCHRAFTRLDNMQRHVKAAHQESSS